MRVKQAVRRCQGSGLPLQNMVTRPALRSDPGEEEISRCKSELERLLQEQPELADKGTMLRDMMPFVKKLWRPGFCKVVDENAALVDSLCHANQAGLEAAATFSKHVVKCPAIFEPFTVVLAGQEHYSTPAAAHPAISTLLDPARPFVWAGLFGLVNIQSELAVITCPVGDATYPADPICYTLLSGIPDPHARAFLAGQALLAARACGADTQQLAGDLQSHHGRFTFPACYYLGLPVPRLVAEAFNIFHKQKTIGVELELWDFEPERHGEAGLVHFGVTPTRVVEREGTLHYHWSDGYDFKDMEFDVEPLSVDEIKYDFDDAAEDSELGIV